MLGLKIIPIRTKTAIWYELDCNTSTQRSTVVVSTAKYMSVSDGNIQKSSE